VRPARASSVVLAAVVTAAVGWFLLDLWSRQGGSRPPLPWAAALGPAIVAIVVLVLARDVRRRVRGESTGARRLDPLAAARVAVLAKASAYAGGVLAGWYVAQGLQLLTQLTSGRRDRLVVAAVTALASVALAVAGLVAQRWCRLPPDDDDTGGVRGDDLLAPPSPRRPEERSG
jgi:ABC-type Fe3+-siderophore transport system permease subunit